MKKNPITIAAIFLMVIGFSASALEILGECLGRVSNNIFNSLETNLMIGICGVTLYFLSKK